MLEQCTEGESHKLSLPEPQYCSSGEVDLAVYCQGDPQNPNIVLVHGYPDNSTVWDTLAALLATQFYVIRYDVRGAGLSSAPKERDGYLLEKLKGDLDAVTTTFCSRAKFHLIAHDWGSVQSWESVSSRQFQARILSYTSISGPCLDHVGHWFRSRSSKLSGIPAVINQLLRSWYIWFFHLPLLPALLWRYLLGRQWARIIKFVEGVAVDGGGNADCHQRRRDGVNGMELYKANCLPRFYRPRQRDTNVPVQLIIPSRDHFLSPDLYRDIAKWAPNNRICHINGGHWLPLTHPDELAELVRGFVNGLSD